ncbi:hypothetical protein ONZ51_g1163 [Trametes cubensis]|uniref:Uncharacterized protein n=1 Tax=Trametes cubensis TaxID=1111947 RepID=A0AAD7U4E3_9APHY|nr:hypothetical protein ONZ51_g1163 [Trametes cubensis]
MSARTASMHMGKICSFPWALAVVPRRLLAPGIVRSSIQDAYRIRSNTSFVSDCLHGITVMQSSPTATETATHGTFIRVYGMMSADSGAVLRRAIDAVRRAWTLESGAEEPLGVYFEGEELVFHDPDGILDDPQASNQSDPDGGLDDPPGTESAWSDHLPSDTDSEDGLMDDKSDDYHDYSTYEGGPSAASSETLLPVPQIKVFLKLACSDYCVREFYIIRMTVTQYKETFVGGFDHIVFNLELDTGSNTTWLRGEHVAEIVPPAQSSNRSSGGEPTEFNIKRISYETLLNKPRIFDHGIDRPYIPEGETATMTEWEGCVCYDESANRAVVLGKPTRLEPFTITLPGACNWGDQESWWQELPVQFTPAIAICGSPYLVYGSPCDGILGLGTSKFQSAFGHLYRHRDVPPEAFIPSFSVALERKLMVKENDPGVVFYFMLRPPPDDEDEPPAPSYLGLQRWPCARQPKWSPRIDISPSGGPWLATLAHLRVWEDVEPTSADPETLARRSASCNIAIDNQWTFSMDTGASSSYFPKDALDAIRAIHFISSRPTDRSEQVAGASYYASPAFWRKNDVTVELIFQNTDQTTVSVYVPALGFLYDTKGEGLVWEAPSAHAKAGSGILGLNFFQVVYAAFHSPPSASNLAPYIHLAPQTRADTSAGLYSVPPLRGEP